MPINAKWMGVAGAALLSMAGLGDAHAGLILSDGFFGTIGSGGTNDLLPSVFGTSTAKGFYGAEVYFTAGWYTFDFLGNESGWSNKFVLGSNSFAVTPGLHTGQLNSFTVYLPAGEAGFSFLADNGASGTVTNGSNPLELISPKVNFFSSFAPDQSWTQTTGDALVLFLDDTGGGNDDDYDDLVVRISSAANIPEPGTLATLVAGFASLAIVLRRRGLV